jgi:ABC-type dipeptide/oligopeptide/nickel transport system permease subunit
MIRGRVFSIREEEYIECEKVMGASDIRTLFYHVLPACSNTLLVRFSTGLAGTLLSMVGLAFMSVGMSTTIPNWGLEVSLGRAYFLLMPHLVMIPAIFIIVTTFGFSMLGDGMRNVIGSGRSN